MQKEVFLSFGLQREGGVPKRVEESQSCPLYCLLTHPPSGGLSAQMPLFQRGGNDDAFKGERVTGGR